MIVSRLQGGLGNQMFQYAFGRMLSERNATSLLLDETLLENPAILTKREFELEIFNIKARLATGNELLPFRISEKYRIFKLSGRLFPFLFPWQNVYESKLAFDPGLMLTGNNTRVQGFWQTEKYFSKIESALRKEFSFKNPATGLNLELAEKILNTDSLSVHVRRGDYISDQNTNNYHGTCSPEYYQSAVAFVSSTVPVSEIFVFSDDSAWVKKNLHFSRPTTYIEHNTGKKSFEDMRLMSLCKHNIIANSSFSWWGAWLNNNHQKQVVAPQKWFNDPLLYSADIIPESWTRI